jgi:non-heme chloroperoxidase
LLSSYSATLNTMPRIPSPHDSASLFYRDYIPEAVPIGSEPRDLTLVFLHGWPMSSRMWQQHILRLCQDHSFRCIAPDRRGFGDSEWNGRCSSDVAKRPITYEIFADDIIYLLEELAVGDFIFIGASMGCGESLLAWERSSYCQQHCKVSPPFISVARASRICH